MELNELQRNWDILGKEDPLWAIITWADKRGNKWDVAEFFASGEREISEVVQYLSALHLDCPSRRALDFGCGVGRLTRALAGHFSNAVGVDIAPSMIARARALDQAGRCQFVLNDRPDLSIFEDQSFDFVYSNLVLQHMRPDYSTAYIREFCRVLAPGGVAVFQLPSKSTGSVRRRSWKDLLRPFIPSPLLRWRRGHYRGLASHEPTSSQPTAARMEMYTVPKRQVLRLVAASGCRVIDATANEAGGPGYESWRYCIAKR